MQNESTSQLEDCYSSQYLFVGGDISVVMTVPGAPLGCATTANSEHCRTELHESQSWSPLDPFNSLSAELMVVDAGGSTVIGQIHMDDATVSVKPAMEMYYDDSSTITVGVEVTRAGGSQATTTLRIVPLGQQFTYELQWDNGQLQAGINGQLFNLNQQQLDNPLS